MKTSSPPPAAAASGEKNVRIKLMEVAERLFAENGVEATQMKQIVAEGGQRNNSVLAYHFGTRRDLIAAILDWRMAELNRLRNIELDRLEAAGLAGDPALLLRALGRPLLDALSRESWGPSYVQVLAQCLYNPVLAAYQMIGSHNLSALVRANALLARALPGVPAETVTTRLSWLSDIFVQTLSRWSRAGAVDGLAATAVDELFDFMVGGLCAPATRSAAGMVLPGDGLARHLRGPVKSD